MSIPHHVGARHAPTVKRSFASETMRASTRYWQGNREVFAPSVIVPQRCWMPHWTTFNHKLGGEPKSKWRMPPAQREELRMFIYSLLRPALPGVDVVID